MVLFSNAMHRCRPLAMMFMFASLLMIAIPHSAGQPSKKKAKEPLSANGWGTEVSTEEFKASVLRVVEVAETDPQLRLLRSAADLGASSPEWKTDVWIPGSRDCRVERLSNTFVYKCYNFFSIMKNWPDDGFRAYENVVKWLQNATGWEVNPQGADDTYLSEVILRGESGGAFISVSLMKWATKTGRRVTITVFPTHHPRSTNTLPSETEVAASSGDNSTDSADERVRSEVDQLARSRQYSAMPAPRRTTPDQTLTEGMVQRSVENGTSYTLRILLSGPVNRELRLAPGQRQSLTLPAGAYRVAAHLTAPNVLPFYGEQTYESGAQYESKFYIQ